MSRPFAAARACALLASLGGIAAGLQLLFAGPGGALLRPVEALGFVLCGICLWRMTAPPPEGATDSFRKTVFGLCLLLKFGSMAALAALAAGAGESWITFGGAIGFFLWGTTAAFLTLAPRRGLPLQFLAIVLLWCSFLSIVERAYGVTAESSFLVAYLMPVPVAVGFLVLGFGLLLARPGDGVWGVVSSRFGGGVFMRRILPLLLVVPFFVGWMRLQGQVHGYYDAAFGFAWFACTNVFVFAIFIWTSARLSNRVDAKRQEAYESLKTGNRELRRVNEALQSEIQGHKSTEEARSAMERQLFQSQKMEAIGTLASGIAHDFNNILTVILLNAESAHESSPSDPVIQQNLAEIRKSGSRAADLIRQIMTFGRKTEGHKTPVRLEDVVTEALEMLRHTLPSNIEVIASIAPDTPQILADSTQVQQVLLNLGTNAAHAMAEQGGRLEIRAEGAVVTPARARLSPELNEGLYARLSVSDSGHGMDEATLKRIFDPFFTTKPPGKGTGLGLSVVHGIMRVHQGSVTAYSEPDKGTIFHLYFPTGAEAAAGGDAPAEEQVPAGRGQSILCVDDNPSILAAITRTLEGLGYRVVPHANPADALLDFLSRPDAFNLAVTDLSMPGISGLELARELLSARPGLPVVLMSGYLRPEDARAAHEAGVRHIILKPDLMDELGKVAHRLLSEQPTQN